MSGPGTHGPDAPRRMVHVFELGVIGGQFRVVEALSVAQREAGLEPAVIAVIAGGGPEAHPLLESMADKGVDVVPLRLPGTRSYLAERRRVVGELRRLGSDVVHTHGYRADVVDAPAARRAGFPTTCTLHGFVGGGRRNRLYESLQRRTVRRLDAVVVVSEPMRSTMLEAGVSPDRLHVVRNAWVPTRPVLDRQSARSRLEVDAGAFRVGWVGRVSEEKGPDVLVDAMRRLDGSGVRASVIGDGPLRDSLMTATESLPIRWHGVVHSADTLFPAFDLFVLSSRTEGTPIVLFEAIRAGVPVVATRVGGVPAVVSGKEALLVDPDDPGALARAILDVRDDPEAARSRAAAARRRLGEEFGPDGWVEGYQEVYRSAVARRQAEP